MRLAAVALLTTTACATVHGSGGPGPGGVEARLAAFLACASPAEFVELQRGEDMPRLVEALDDWSAVRLGAVGPLLGGADILARKRASFLVDAVEDYGGARAEVFALFIVHGAFDDELRAMLEVLAGDKQLQETLGPMDAARAELERRGLKLSDFPERGTRLGDVGRGLGRAARDALRTSPASDGARYMDFHAKRNRLPPPYQEALHEVDSALMRAHFAKDRVVLGAFDHVTFGVPLGLYGLVTGTAQGASSLVKGEFERAARELAPALLLVAFYAGGKVARTPGGLRLNLMEVAARLKARLGESGVIQLARHIQARREAGILVAAGGEPAAMALLEARGDVARAQLWMAKAPGLSADVVQAKLLHVEVESAGARLPPDVALLEQQRPRLDAPPPGVPEGSPLWGDYVAYREGRLAELKSGQAVKGPLRWDGYERMWGHFARGLDFERTMTALLRADVALPKAQRRWLQDFNEPAIETNVGVAKPGAPGVRFADALVIEQKPAPGQPPRVESFSFKSRDMTSMGDDALTAQMAADATAALRFYGGKLDIRRPSFKHLGPEVQVRRVRLIYESGRLRPSDARVLPNAIRATRALVKDVEVSAQ